MKYALLIILVISFYLSSCDLVEPEQKDGRLIVKVLDSHGNQLEGAEIHIFWDEMMPPTKLDPPPVEVFVHTQIIGLDQVRVFWGCLTDPGILGYRVYRSSFADGSHLEPLGNGEIIDHIPGCVTYEVFDNRVTYGKIYYYYVRTYGPNQADWGISDAAMAVVSTPPPPYPSTAWDLRAVHASFNGTALLLLDVATTGRCSISIKSQYYGSDFVIVDQELEARAYYVFWDGMDDQGADVANGIYEATLYSYDEQNQPVRQKSVYLLKNNLYQSNMPVAISSSSPLVLPFSTFFRYDLPLSYITGVDSNMPYRFWVYVKKDGYEPVSRTINVTVMNAGYYAIINMYPANK